MQLMIERKRQIQMKKKQLLMHKIFAYNLIDKTKHTKIQTQNCNVI